MRQAALRVASLFLLTNALVACGGGTTRTNVEGSEPPPEPPTSDNLSIANVTINQGVAIPLVRDGAALPKQTQESGAPSSSRRPPIIPNRPALIRVRVATSTLASTKPVMVTLHFTFPDQGTGAASEFSVSDVPKNIASSKRGSASSFLPEGDPAADEAIGTAFDIRVDPDRIRVGMKLAVDVFDPSIERTATPASTILSVPSFTIGVVPHAPTLKVVAVPIHYTADGRDALPDLEAPMLDLYRNDLYRMYPVAAVEITKREKPIEWPLPIEPSGKGWFAVTHELVNMHQAEAVSDDVYYTAIFNPGVAQEEYCKAGCVGGLAVNPFDFFGSEIDRRVSMILSYSSENVRGAFAQELAHSMSRAHAPCGSPNFLDTRFPYDDGTIGHWGWDVISKVEVPADTYDFMSYCSPIWVSDYTYQNIFTKMLEIEASARAVERVSSLSHSASVPMTLIRP